MEQGFWVGFAIGYSVLIVFFKLEWRGWVKWVLNKIGDGFHYLAKL